MRRPPPSPSTFVSACLGCAVQNVSSPSPIILPTAAARACASGSSCSSSSSSSSSSIAPSASTEVDPVSSSPTGASWYAETFSAELDFLRSQRCDALLETAALTRSLQQQQQQQQQQPCQGLSPAGCVPGLAVADMAALQHTLASSLKDAHADLVRLRHEVQQLRDASKGIEDDGSIARRVKVLRSCRKAATTAAAVAAAPTPQACDSRAVPRQLHDFGGTAPPLTPAQVPQQPPAPLLAQAAGLAAPPLPTALKQADPRPTAAATCAPILAVGDLVRYRFRNGQSFSDGSEVGKVTKVLKTGYKIAIQGVRLAGYKNNVISVTMKDGGINVSTRCTDWASRSHTTMWDWAEPILTVREIKHTTAEQATAGPQNEHAAKGDTGMGQKRSTAAGRPPRGTAKQTKKSATAAAAAAAACPCPKPADAARRKLREFQKFQERARAAKAKAASVVATDYAIPGGSCGSPTTTSCAPRTPLTPICGDQENTPQQRRAMKDLLQPGSVIKVQHGRSSRSIVSTVRVLEGTPSTGRRVWVADPVTRDRFPVDLDRIVGAAEPCSEFVDENANAKRRTSRRRSIKTDRLVDRRTQ